MKNKVSVFINVLISAFLLVGEATFLHPCKGEVPMACNYSVNAAKGILILLLILNIGKWFTGDRKAQIAMNVTTMTGCILLIVTPKLGACNIATMTCNTRSFPALMIGGLFMFAFTVIFMIFDGLDKRRARHVHSK